MNNTFAYDLEVYQNFFSAIFVNITDENDIYEFCLHKNRDDIQALTQFVSQPDLRLTGYNNNRYDNLIIKALLQATTAITNRKLYNLSKQIIDKKFSDYNQYVKNLAYSETPFESVDLMELVSINTIRPALKYCAIHLKFSLIQDLPLDPEKPVKDFDLLLKYNLNDVQATRILYLTLIPDIELREQLGKVYGVDLLSASDSKIAKAVLDQVYGVPVIKATERRELWLGDLIPSKLRFNSKYLQDFLKGLRKKKIYISQHSTRINEDIVIGGVSCKLAQGGIHSDDKPGLFESDNEYILIDSDVNSYYPAIIVNENIAPEHLDKKRFLSVYKSLIERRLEAKKNGDMTTANTLKITVNSTFGLMGFPYYWLSDPKCMYQVTISGQLYLIDLAEKLVEGGMQLVSMNTDGVLFKVKRSEIENYHTVCGQWEQRTGYTLEHSEYSLYARRDVNNYMAIGNKVKTKGIFVDGLKLNKRTFITAYNAPVIALSLQAYFKNSVDPEHTINAETDIHNFLFSQRTDKKFNLFAEKIERGKIVRTNLQKTNRWLVAKNGYRLKKYHQFGGSDTALMKDCNVIIANDINNVSLADVYRQYYIDETWKIIYEIIGKPVQQMSLI